MNDKREPNGFHWDFGETLNTLILQTTHDSVIEWTGVQSFSINDASTEINLLLL